MYIMKKVMKNKDGKYVIKDNVFDELVGSRAQVMHGTAYKTAGGLIKKNLKKCIIPYNNLQSLKS